MYRKFLLSLPLTVGLSVSAQAADIAQICADGAAEPPLVWYSSAVPARNDAIVAAFNAKYPDIQVQILRMTSGQAATRYASERDSGVVNADLVAVANEGFYKAGVEKGWFANIQKTDLPSLGALDDASFKDGVSLVGIYPAGIIYNSAMIDKPLESWQDLLRPELKGNILLGDPRSVPVNLAVFKQLRDAYGDDFLKALAAQQPSVLTSITPGVQQVAAGEKELAFPSIEDSAVSLIEAGAELAFFGKGPITGYEFQIAVSEGADSPNAARCMYDFALSVEGQQNYVGKYGVSPIGAEGTQARPDGYAAPNLVNLSKEDEAAIAQLLGLK